VQSFKTLYTGRAQERTRVIARRMRAVRSQHQGRAVCGRRPLGERKSFFGDFLPISKKLPAGRRTAEALALAERNNKLKRHPHPNPLPPAGEGIKAGFQLSLE